jgi:hypothetical protein
MEGFFMKRILVLLIMACLLLPSSAFTAEQGPATPAAAQETSSFRVTVGAAPSEGAQEAADAAAVLGASKGISAGAVTAAVLGAAAVAGAIAAAGSSGGGSQGHGH